jgi:hypothetical protein
LTKGIDEENESVIVEPAHSSNERDALDNGPLSLYESHGQIRVHQVIVIFLFERLSLRIPLFSGNMNISEE